MKELISRNIRNPLRLEELYQQDKKAFRMAFFSAYNEFNNEPAAACWHARLSYKSDAIVWGKKYDWLLVLLLGFLAGCVAKIPAWFELKNEVFYSRNISFIVLPFLAFWFVFKQKLNPFSWIIITLSMAFSAVFINSFPEGTEKDSFILSCIHLPFLNWFILGYAFSGKEFFNTNKRLEFLKYNGDLLVMTTVIVLAGALLSGLTIGLFSLIGLNIERFYSEYIILWGGSAAPVVATWLVRSNPQLVGRVSPVIARVFTPLVLITLLIYLVAVLYTGKDPYNDREFLLVFNFMLIGVMAIILFSVTEAASGIKSRVNLIFLFLLACTTIWLNAMALSAILYRIQEWGFTANRTAVLGSNVLVLIHLILVTISLFKAFRNENAIDDIGRAMVKYLPLYLIWVTLVVFIFPFVF